MGNISIRKIHAVSKNEYKKFIFDSRNIIIVCMLIVIYDVIIKELMKMCDKMGEDINVLEPFIALCGSGLIAVIIPAIFMVLISDFPKIDGNARFYIIRVGKINWILGQMLFAIESAITYIAVTFFAMTLSAAMHMHIVTKWSDVVTRYYIKFPEELNSAGNLLINETMYNQFKPMEGFVYIFTLYLLLLLAIAMVNMVSFMFNAGNMGNYISGISIMLGGVMVFLDYKAMWVFPIANVMVWKHCTTVFKTRIFPISASYYYFAVIITLCILTVYCMFDRKNFDDL